MSLLFFSRRTSLFTEVVEIIVFCLCLLVPRVGQSGLESLDGAFDVVALWVSLQIELAKYHVWSKENETYHTDAHVANSDVLCGNLLV